MKIAHIETVFNTGGGIPRIVTSLMRATREDGGDAKYICGRVKAAPPPEWKEDVIRFGTDFSVKCHGLRARLFDSAALGSVSATRQMVAYLEAYDPDVIHLHSLLGYYVDIRTLFAYLRRSGKPVVWTQHDCWALTGHCIHFAPVGCEKWKTGCGSCPQIRSYPGSWLLDRSARNYALKRELFTSLPNLTVVTPCEWIAEMCRTSFLGKYPVKTIPNGIDLGLYHPVKSDFRGTYGIGNKTLLLSVASTWSTTKGRRFLFEAWEKLDHNRYAMVCIGAPKDGLTVPEGVIAIDRADGLDTLIRWYSEADVFLNPTLADTFPTVNLESLACGTPVITFPTGGSPEAIDEKSGLVTREKSAEALLEALHKWESYPFDREDCVARAQCFRAEDRYRDYIALYRQILCQQ